MQHKDDQELIAALNALAVPNAPADGVAAIVMRAARTPQQRSRRWFAPVQTLRAYLFLPPIRYGIMASIVAGFIVIGLIGGNSAPKAPSPQQMADKAETHPAVKADLLIDVDFAEEDWAVGLIGRDL